MPRIPREDGAGSWHHVINRAIARRTMFERREDFRYFCAQLAKAVRRGEIEVHAYCLMGTHYHLLVRSPSGNLGEAMRQIQLAYSRWFNRSRRRDGSLVRGRYFSKPVDSIAYRRLLVRYIDSNPVGAHIVSQPAQYPYGSARNYSSQTGPLWLERNWVEGVVKSRTDSGVYMPSAYSTVFGSLPQSLRDVVDSRLSHKGTDDFLDDLVASSGPSVRAWMVRKAKLADGTWPGLPVLSLRAIQNELDPIRQQVWNIQRGRTKRDAWRIAFAGLGRDLSGVSLSELALKLDVSHSAVSKLCQLHRQLVVENADYSQRVATITHAALRSWRSV